jgi:Asp-tRNA(Asn)/Glu-tRNA(Gln) amidotransferase A subunit family amidase
MPNEDSVHSLPPAAYNTALANITNNPAVSVPIGVLANGVPCGMQIVAAHWQDSWLLDLAHKWETVHPWPRVAEGFETFTSTLN